MKKLCTIDANTLQSVDYEPISFLVEDLLPPGLHLLAGAPKIGKSWLALWLCLQVAQGKPLWNFSMISAPAGGSRDRCDRHRDPSRGPPPDDHGRAPGGKACDL